MPPPKSGLDRISPNGDILNWDNQNARSRYKLKILGQDPPWTKTFRKTLEIKVYNKRLSEKISQPETVFC